jgi:hypothetical protein
VLVANDPAVKTALNATGGAPICACRAWVNFRGTGTVTIRESFNVSSITDDGAGLYTENFIVPMVDANYAITSSCGTSNGYQAIVGSRSAKTASNAPIGVTNANDAHTDQDYIDIAVFR